MAYSEHSPCPWEYPTEELYLAAKEQERERQNEKPRRMVLVSIFPPVFMFVDDED